MLQHIVERRQRMVDIKSNGFVWQTKTTTFTPTTFY